MSEPDTTSPNRTTKFVDDSIATESPEDIVVLTRTETVKNPPTDLRNSTSADDDENENESDPEPEVEISEETCSRARPYVRGGKASGQSSTGCESVGLVVTPTISVSMPTPPDEPDTLLPTTTLIPKHPIQTPAHHQNGNKTESTVVPESLQTEQQTTTCDDIKGSPDQKHDSEGEKYETLSTSTSTTDPGSETSSGKTQQEEIIEPLNNKSVSCHKNNTNSSLSTGSRKGSKIPVGIAVVSPWQRLVTSAMSTVGNSTTSVTTAAPSIPSDRVGDHKLSELPCPSSPIKIPLRPSSASSITPIKISSTGKEDKVKRGSSGGGGDSGHVLARRSHHNNISRSVIESKSHTPELTSVNLPSRPMPSSSVPPNLGLSYLHGSLMEYHYGMRGASSPYHHHSSGHGILPPSWPQASSDLSVPQGFNSPGAAAAYLQQTMHNQMQLQQQFQQAHQHHSYSSNYGHPSASYLHPGYETLRQQYEQLILQNHHQQQHSELLRQYHHHHQQQQQHQYQHQQLLSSQGATPMTLAPTGISPSRVSIPILSPSPTSGGVRTPTPTTTKLNHHSLSLSNLTGTGLPNWPAELYHHNSSIALSPKSLTSSTPSPVTVQHDFNNLTTPTNLVNSIGGGGGSAFQQRKSDSPNNNKTFPPTLSPIASSRKECITTTKTQQHNDTYETENSEKKKPEDLRAKLEQHDGSEECKKSDLPQRSPQHKHDFTRMESLIEKRCQESIHLLNEEENVESSKQDEKEANEIDKIQEANMGNADMKHLVVKVEEPLTANQIQLPIPDFGLNVIKSETTTKPDAKKPSVKTKKPRKATTEKLGKLKTKVKVRGSESKKPLEPKKKVVKKVKTSTGPEVDKPKPLKKKKDLSQSGKKSEPRVVKQPKNKAKKKSDDFVNTKSKKRREEDYNNIIIGNVVPDLTLPVASSTFNNKLKDNINNAGDKPNFKVGLSQQDSTAVLNGGGNGTLMLLTGTSRDSHDIIDNKKTITTGTEKGEKYFNSEQSSSSINSSSISGGSSKRVSDTDNNNPLQNKIEKTETKYNSIRSNNNVYASQSNVTSDDEMNRDVSITTTTTTSNITPSTATVIITSPNQSISFCAGNPISLKPLTITPATRLNIIPSTNPDGVHHHTSTSTPLTLFLPSRIQSNNMNSSQQTSYKFVVASQDMKIPTFFPSSSSTGGTLQFYQQQQQTYSTTTTLQQQTTVNVLASSSTSSLFATPCDNESSSNKKNNTITIIAPANPSATTYQIRQTILPTTTLHQQLPYVEPIQQQQQIQSSNIYNIRKDFIEPGENHLNLLATVAQEFGTRDDLGKLKISSSSNTSTTCSFIPTSIDNNNFHPNNMQNSSSINISNEMSNLSIISMQSPSQSVTTCALSSSVPTIITSNSIVPKSSYDEYEYPDEKEHAGSNEMSSAGSSSSYKQAVWLKIPQVIPKAATKVAEKLLKAQRKQEKVLQKITTKKPKTPKKKRDNLTSSKGLAESGKSSSIRSSSGGDNYNTQTKATKPITQRAKGSPKKSLNKTEAPKINEQEDNRLVGSSKLKIPKIIPDSLTKLPTKRRKESSRSRSRSPEKSHKKAAQTSFEHSTDLAIKEPISMKMTLPVPKVAKIRIKLSETQQPTLLSHNFNNKKDKIKRRHSDGDKLSPKKKHRRSNHHSQSLDSDLIQNNNKNNKRRKQSHDEQEYGSSKASKVIRTKELDDDDNNLVSETARKCKSSAEDLLSSSFTSLTPPPTANPLLFELGSPHSSESHPILFSPSNLENENETENEDENDFNWVADPTFAVSAIRLSNTTNQNGPSGDNETSGGSSSGTKLTKKSSERKEKRERKSCKPSKLSLLNPRTEEEPQENLNDNNSVEKDLKSQLKSFVHFAPKRLNSSTGGSKRQERHHHHIKPCLKAEPIVRPHSSLDGDEDSDAEIDLEVASLTKSISPTHKSSFYQPNNNPRKQTISNNSSPIKTPSSSLSPSKTKKRSSSTHSSKEKNFSRRLSLNLDRSSLINKTHSDSTTSEEELPDIDEDYPTTTSFIKIPTLGQSSTTTENENKQINNNNNNNNNSGISSSWQPKRFPRKRSSRSSTATSTQSEKPVSSSSFSRSSVYSGVGECGLMSSDLLEDETLVPGKIELESVTELLDEMRILTEIQGLFYTGKLNALNALNGVFGVTLDNERGVPPHLIFSAEEVLEKCIREKKPQNLTVALRICAYWSPQYSGLYPGRVSTDFNPNFDPEKDLIPIEFDDGDTGMIKLGEIRLLPSNHPIRAYDPNPLLTLEKKHRKRRHSSTNTSSGCTGDHEEADCGESFCAKVGKYEEEDDELKDTQQHPFKSAYWTWTGLGYKRPKSKKNRHKEFFRGIQRGDEVINVGDSAIFISHGNERPYIGRVERFWEKKGQKVVNVRWFYHPEEVKSPRRIPHLKHPGALFESPHIDENDVQTIAKKCDVLPFPEFQKEFKERIGRMPKLSLKNSTTTTASKPKDLYYICGFYDPYNYNLQLKI